VKLNPELPRQKQHSTRRRFFSPANWTYIYIYIYKVNCYIWNIVVYGAEIWTLRKVDQKYLERF